MKKKWTVIGLVDASYIVGEFEAETGEQAAEKAWAEAHSPSICHQCSGELTVGDVYDLRALADDGDSYEGEVDGRMADLEAERDRYRKALEDTRDYLSDCAGDPQDDQFWGFSDAAKAIGEVLNQ